MTEQHYRMTLSDAIAFHKGQVGVIYRIYCEKTNFSYIGQTRDINKNGRLSRIKSHYAALKKDCHPYSKLQAAWNATGGESIKHEILEIIAPVQKAGTNSNEKMAQAEKRWQEVHSCYELSTSVDRYYALKAGELKKLRDAGILNNATFVYFILKLKNPWCDRPLRIKPLELSVEWDMPESSVYEAIGKLKNAELVSIEEAEIVLKWNSQEDSFSDNPESLRDVRMNSEIPECFMESQNEFRDSRTDSEIPENRQPEAAPDKGCTTPHTLKTYSDFNNSLSDSERESFLDFGNKKAGQLPHPPELPQRWIEKNFDELRSQWYKSTGKVSPAQSSKWEADPRRQEWMDKIRSLGFAAFIYESSDLDKERKEFYEWANSNNLIWGDET